MVERKCWLNVNLIDIFNLILNIIIENDNEIIV